MPTAPRPNHLEAVEVLEDLGRLQPGPEAGQALISDLFPPFIRDHLSVLLQDHQLGYRGDLVALLQLTVTTQRRESAPFLQIVLQ